MIRNLGVMFLAALIFAEPMSGQILTERGLKGLSSVAILIQPSTDQAKEKVKEWGDRLEVALTKAIPGLGRSKSDGAKAWLKLHVVSTSSGTVLELGVYRSTRIIDSGEVVFAKVWEDSRYLFGGSSEAELRESIDKLVTSFAADFARANRRTAVSYLEGPAGSRGSSHGREQPKADNLVLRFQADPCQPCQGSSTSSPMKNRPSRKLRGEARDSEDHFTQDMQDTDDPLDVQDLHGHRHESASAALFV